MRKTVSPLAKELRKIRIDHDINRTQMAKDLKLSTQVLENIELGKVEASDDFLRGVAIKYSRNRDASNGLLELLKVAYVESISTVTFDLATLDTQQRLRVLALRAALAEENAVAIAAAEAEKKKERERRAAERAAKKQQQKEDEGVGFIASGDEVPLVESTDDAIDELSDEELDILAA